MMLSVEHIHLHLQVGSWVVTAIYTFVRNQKFHFSSRVPDLFFPFLITLFIRTCGYCGIQRVGKHKNP
ncbi:hypothetical protein BX600DRAFT_475600 [Xylariales sp. PMI_506]|nr:hypothetical protein BX600DRAFT_475600 [Xylariales sp. PMI_506]